MVVAHGIDPHVIAGSDAATQNVVGQRVCDAMLDDALERASAERRVVALADDQLLGLVRQFQRDAPVAQQFAQATQLDVDDRL